MMNERMAKYYEDYATSLTNAFSLNSSSELMSFHFDISNPLHSCIGVMYLQMILSIYAEDIAYTIIMSNITY